MLTAFAIEKVEPLRVQTWHGYGISSPLQIMGIMSSNWYTRETIFVMFSLMYALGTVILCGGIFAPLFYAIYIERTKKGTPEDSTVKTRMWMMAL